MFNSIFNKVNDEAVARAVGILHDNARNKFKVEPMIKNQPITTMGELMDLSIKFVRNQFKFAICPEKNDTISEDFAWSVAVTAIEQKYPDGLQGALRACKCGVDGGCRGFIETLWQFIKSGQEQMYRKYILETEAGISTWENKVSLAKRFLERISCVVPEESQKHAEEIAANIEKIIEGHIKMTGVSYGKSHGFGRQA
jgi:hypothetical protein